MINLWFELSMRKSRGQFDATIDNKSSSRKGRGGFSLKSAISRASVRRWQVTLSVAADVTTSHSNRFWGYVSSIFSSHALASVTTTTDGFHICSHVRGNIQSVRKVSDSPFHLHVSNSGGAARVGSSVEGREDETSGSLAFQSCRSVAPSSDEVTWLPAALFRARTRPRIPGGSATGYN